MIWFGSWISGTAVEHSDIDLGIDAGEPLAGVVRARLEEEIESLPTLRGIDLVDLQAVSHEFRTRVLSEGLPL